MSDDKPARINVQTHGSLGIVWFIGWLFTASFASLQWWQVLLGLLVWPYYLGSAVR
ncbi:MAG TPA: hypothetical protein VIG99_28985 [Myxococcaceae bacterium]|jgi:hypothetical protein